MLSVLSLKGKFIQQTKLNDVIREQFEVLYFFLSIKKKVRKSEGNFEFETDV